MEKLEPGEVFEFVMDQMKMIEDIPERVNAIENIICSMTASVAAALTDEGRSFFLATLLKNIGTALVCLECFDFDIDQLEQMHLKSEGKCH